MSKPPPDYRSKRHKDKKPIAAEATASSAAVDDSEIADASDARKAALAAKAALATPVTEEKKPKRSGPAKGDGGRPVIEIDEEEFENLCGIGCTEEEIAQWFRTNVDTISAWCVRTYGGTFSEEKNKKFQIGKASLRRTRFQRALAGDATMIIWLSKQLLNEVDSSHRMLSGPNGAPIQVEGSTKRVDLSLLSDTEVEQLFALQKKLTGNTEQKDT